MKCPNCGSPVRFSHRICSSCGHTLVFGPIAPAVFAGVVWSALTFLPKFPAGQAFRGFSLAVLLIGSIVHLIMRKGFKMKGREQTICLLIDVQLIYVLLGYVVSLALQSVAPDFLDQPLTANIVSFLLDGILALVAMIFAGVFYARKSRVCALVLIVLEFLYLLANAWNAYALLSFAPETAIAGVFHVIWRSVILFLLIRWLLNYQKEAA